MPDPVSDPPALDAVTAALSRLPALLEADPALVARGRFLTTQCLIGCPEAAFHLDIIEGRIIAMEPGPLLMRSFAFSYRARPEALLEYWRPMPRPGWHDLLALTKRGAAQLEGEMHPFVAHLQYFKDLLALPRGSVAP